MTRRHPLNYARTHPLRVAVIAMAVLLDVVVTSLAVTSSRSVERALATLRGNQLIECQQDVAERTSRGQTIGVLLAQQERGLRELEELAPSLATPEIYRAARRNIDEQVAVYRAELGVLPQSSLADCERLYG